jgi:amidohydrolase
MVNFLAEARDLFSYAQELRRDFHRHPELGFEEIRSGEVVAEQLGELPGVQVAAGVAETGVVGLLEGNREGPVVLLRFDMDALPIQEETGAAYASQNPGVMHACGHDGHMAIGLTAARLLVQHREMLAGSVKLVFQPAEEGLGGAERMIAEGVLKNPVPDYILALHLWNEKQIGWFGITDGPLMAASETFRMRVIGKGGHGAIPDQAVDPVLAASQIITSMQSIVSREVSPLDPAVVTFGSIHGGQAHNVIPSEVTLQGTIRSFSKSSRELILARFQELAAGVGKAFRCQVEMEIEDISPAVINQPEVAEVVRGKARELFPELIVDDRYQTMGSEDMALMMADTPSCYFLIGSANQAQGLTAKHHHPQFDFDERALIHGSALMAASAAALLQP